MDAVSDFVYNDQGIQASLDSKSNTGHTHTNSEITDFGDGVDARIANVVVNLTGDQDISGRKNFIGNLQVNGNTSNPVIETDRIIDLLIDYRVSDFTIASNTFTVRGITGAVTATATAGSSFGDTIQPLPYVAPTTHATADTGKIYDYEPTDFDWSEQTGFVSQSTSAITFTNTITADAALAAFTAVYPVGSSIPFTATLNIPTSDTLSVNDVIELHRGTSTALGNQFPGNTGDF